MVKLMLSVFLLSIFTSSYGEQISAYSDNNPLLGTWKYVKTIVNVKTNNPEASRIIKEDILSEPRGTLSFLQDGSGSYDVTAKDENESFGYNYTYELTADSLTIYAEDANGEDEPDSYSYKLVNQTLTLTSDDTEEYDPDTLEDLEIENPEQIKVEKVLITYIYTRINKATSSNKNL